MAKKKKIVRKKNDCGCGKSVKLNDQRRKRKVNNKNWRKR